MVSLRSAGRCSWLSNRRSAGQVRHESSSSGRVDGDQGAGDGGRLVVQSFVRDLRFVVAQLPPVVRPEREASGLVEGSVQPERGLGADDGGGRRRVAQHAGEQHRDGPGGVALRPRRSGPRPRPGSASAGPGWPGPARVSSGAEDPAGEPQRVGQQVVARSAGQVGAHDAVVGREVLAHVRLDGVDRRRGPRRPAAGGSRRTSAGMRTTAPRGGTGRTPLLRPSSARPPRRSVRSASPRTCSARRTGRAGRARRAGDGVWRRRRRRRPGRATSSSYEP